MKTSVQPHAEQLTDFETSDASPQTSLEEAQTVLKQSIKFEWRKLPAYQWIFGLVCLGVMMLSNIVNLNLNNDNSQITNTLSNFYIGQQQTQAVEATRTPTSSNQSADVASESVHVASEEINVENINKNPIPVTKDNRRRHACDKRTKDITLTGYPYSTMSVDNQLMRMERAFFSRREYFEIVREETGFPNFASPQTNAAESFELIAVGEGVRIFSGDSFPATSSESGKGAYNNNNNNNNIMSGSRLFVGVGDWGVFDACIALAAQVTGAKPRMFANQLPRPVQTDTNNPAPDYNGVEVTVVSGDNPQTLLEAAKTAWSDEGSNNVIVIFIWLETLDTTSTFRNFVGQTIAGSGAAHATVIMGNGFHGLIREFGGKFGEKLMPEYRKTRVNSALRDMMHTLGPLRSETPLAGGLVLDLVWTGSMILDSANLMALPSPDTLVNSLGISHDLNMLPTFDQQGIQRTRTTFRDFPLHHVSRGLFDRRYPGVRCDGMGYSASVNAETHNDGCVSTWRVLESYAQVILNVVESGHDPLEYLPFSCVT